MTDYALIATIFSLCFLWAAYRERVSNNWRDSRLLLTLSLVTGLGGAGVFVATA